MPSRLFGGGGGSSTTDASLLTTGTLPLARLSGITTSQLDAAAAITSAQIAALDAAKITTGTLPLARLSGITTSQLAAGAAITSGQIASVAASTLTGTNTLPDGVLSTNVPLLNAGNTFTALQTIAASIAGPLAQINNGSTTGAGLVIGSTTVASAGAGKIAPALACTQAAPATANYGLVSIGGGPWDGSTSGFYPGNSAGTVVAVNAASGFTGSLVDMRRAGTSGSYFKIDASTGNTTFTFGTLACSALQVANGQNIVEAGNSCPYLTFGSNALTVNTRLAANVGLTIKGSASQTADLFQAQNSASAVQFGMTNRGSAGSPIWALKVRATANAESAAQAHTIGAATGKAIEVMDDAGASLGWIALYA